MATEHQCHSARSDLEPYLLASVPDLPSAMTTPTPAHLLQIEAQIKAMVQRKSREIDERLARCAAELGYKATGNSDCPYA